MAKFYDIDTNVRINGDLLVPSSTLDANLIKENGVLLSSKYLGINSKASDSDKLDNLDSSSFFRRDINSYTTNNLFVHQQNNIGSESIISLAIGDKDTGFDWVGDGNFQVWTDSKVIIDFGKNGTTDFKFNPTVASNTIWHAGNDGSGSGLDADKLDGLDSSDLSLSGHTHDDRYYTETEVDTKLLNKAEVDKSNSYTKNIGWYRIAKNVGNRAFGRFVIQERDSGSHQTVEFSTGIHYSNSPVINVISNSSYSSGGSFRHIRILYNGTYDEAYLEVYVDRDSVSGCQTGIYRNIQSSGWTIVEWSNGSVPTGYSSLQISLDTTGGFNSTDEIYASNGNKVFHTGNFNPSGKSDTSHTHTWSEITSKPSTFTPSSHSHNYQKYSLTQDSGLQKSASTDWNNYSASGFYMGSALTNQPTTGTGMHGWKYVNTYQHNSAYSYQKSVDFNGEEMHFRAYTDGAWNPWNRVWHDNNFDPSTKSDVHSHPYVNTSGGTMTGNLNLTDGNGIVFSHSENTVKSSSDGFNLDVKSNGNITINADNNNSLTTESVSIGAGLNKLIITSSGSSTGDKIEYNSNKIWHSGNDGSGSGLDADKLDGLNSSQFVRNDSSDQSVLGSFSINGNGNLFVGSSAGDGDIILKDASGSNVIHFDGGSDGATAGTKSYIAGNGNADFAGNVKSNSISVSSTSTVTNLNADYVDGLHASELSKNESTYELGGKGVYSGLNVVQQSVPNMSVRIESGIAYTDTGMRKEILAQSVSISTASSSYSRYDVVYIRGSESGANEGKIAVVTGSSSSTVPSIPSTGIKLAEVSVPINIGSIQNTHITDKREWKPFKTINGNTEIFSNLYMQTDKITSTLRNVVEFGKPVKNTGSNTAITFTSGQTSKTWTHNLNLSNYTIKFSCNSPEPHIYWSSQSNNSIVVNFDDVCESDVVVHASIEAF